MQKVINSMQKMKVEKGFMDIKFDLKKAYNHIHWDFLIDTIKEIGI